MNVFIGLNSNLTYFHKKFGSIENCGKIVVKFCTVYVFNGELFYHRSHPIHRFIFETLSAANIFAKFSCEFLKDLRFLAVNSFFPPH